MNTTAPNSDARIRNAERTHHADPTPESAEVVERLKARATPIVRTRGAFGFLSCDILGELVKETAKGYSYRDAATGKVKNVKKVRRPTCAGMGNREAHLVACTSCDDHIATTRGAGFCMHNTPIADHCERCLCM
jgi:hypothetical protein